MLCFTFTETNTKQFVLLVYKTIWNIISQLSQEVAEFLGVHSACFVIACLGHLYGNMLISIFAGSIVQPKTNWTPL